MDERRLGSSSERLWDLIAQRTERGADTQEIDRRIWDLFGEEWAVMFTDLAGFSRRVEEFGIIHFLQIIHEHKLLVLPIVAEHDGLLIKTEGDSLMLLFRRPSRAIQCAIAMQQVCESTSARRRPEEQILLCIGIGYGKLLRIGDEDVWGREVNAASKLGEDTAGPSEILITQAAHDRAIEEGLTGLQFELLADEVAGSPTNYRLVR